ncbi:hypothetical protein MHBO_004926 [Bonamia ostreae]|uniref:Uncharacterized protein n=1 Tax=Bonamia ostreae TaxID=126728 RepID=A0ABV2AUL4_9EUKA
MNEVMEVAMSQDFVSYLVAHQLRNETQKVVFNHYELDFSGDSVVHLWMYTTADKLH